VKDQAAELLRRRGDADHDADRGADGARARLRIASLGPRGHGARLHAESFKATPEISDQLAAKLRQLVHQHRGQLPSELVESIGDTSARGAA
jgi:hypothetical protein